MNLMFLVMEKFWSHPRVVIAIMEHHALEEYPACMT